MPEREDETTTTLVGYFGSRAAAETASERLSEVSSEPPRLAVGREAGYAVTLVGLRPERVEAARSALHEAGAARIETAEPDSAMAPRPVQPGFTDAAPGIVPKAADFPAGRYEDTGGRFSEQLDRAPEKREK